MGDIFVSVKEDTLTGMVGAMSDKVGLVHQMPFACDRTGLPATLEKVSLQNVIISWFYSSVIQAWLV